MVERKEGDREAKGCEGEEREREQREKETATGS